MLNATENVFEVAEKAKFPKRFRDLFKLMKNSLAKYAEKQSRAVDLTLLNTPRPDLSDLTGAMGVGLPAVTGQKKAKQEKKEMDAIQNATKQFTKRMDTLVSISQQMADSLNGNLASYKAYMDMARHHASKGNTEMEDRFVNLASDALMAHGAATGGLVLSIDRGKKQTT